MTPLQKLAVVMAIVAVLRVGCWAAAHALRWMLERIYPRRQLAPAVFIGRQEFPGRPGFELYNLTADIPGHPVHSTVSRETLEAAGYIISPKK